MLVLLMLAKVVGDRGNPLRQERNLDFRGTRIVRLPLELRDCCCLLIRIQATLHFTFTSLIVWRSLYHAPWHMPMQACPESQERCREGLCHPPAHPLLYIKHHKSFGLPNPGHLGEVVLEKGAQVLKVMNNDIAKEIVPAS